MNSCRLILKAFLVQLVAVILTFISFPAQSKEVVDRILVVVNSEIVTESDLSSLQKKINSNGFIDDLLLMGNKLEDVKKSRSLQVDYLVNERIVDSEIKRLNLSVTVERVEQEIKDIAKKNGMTRNELLNAVRGQGVGAAEYQDFIKSRVERQSLIESEVTSKIRVSDEDLSSYYARKHGISDVGTYEYSLAHIFFNPKKGGMDSAQKRAEQVHAKLKAAGASFDDIAEQNSEDPDFTTGGTLGTFKAGELSKEFSAAVSGLSAGEFSAPVKSRSGVHILKVVSKKVVTDPQFEKEKEKIRSVLFDQAFQRNFKSWIASKKDESFLRENFQ